MTICLNCDCPVIGRLVLCCTCGHFCSKKCMEEYHEKRQGIYRKHKPKIKEN